MPSLLLRRGTSPSKPSRQKPQVASVLCFGLVCVITMIGFLVRPVVLDGQMPADLQSVLMSLPSENPIQVGGQVESAATETTSSGSEASKGWKAIHVFYGDQDYLDEQRAINPQTKDKGVWVSQGQQDRMIATLFRNKKSGYFIDLAANNALALSNTYALEKELGWTGLCMEPNPKYWHDLSFRDCEVVGAVVGGIRMEKVKFAFHKAGVLGGIIGDKFNYKEPEPGKAVSVSKYTVPLLDILQKFHVTRNQIDYLSLDVEGAETYIMQNFPFDEYTIKVMTIERPNGPLKALLRSKGYKHWKTMKGWGETLWIHEWAIDELDTDTLNAQFTFLDANPEASLATPAEQQP